MLKRVISVLLLVGIAWLIATRDGWSGLLESAGSFSPRWLLLALLFPWIAVSSSVLRWKTLLHAEGAEIPTSRLMGIFLRGRFVGAFTPSTTGLDVYRAVATKTETGDEHIGGRVVLVEKLYGLISLALVTFALLPFGLHRFFGVVGVAVAAALGVTGVAILAWMESRARRPITSGTGRVRRFLQRISQAASLSPSTRARVLGLGLICHLATALGFAAAGRAIGVEVGFFELAIVGNAIVIAMLVPISVGGFGVREGTAVAMLSIVGVSATAAVLMAFVGYLVAQPPALIGGLSQLMGWRPSPQLSTAS